MSTTSHTAGPWKVNFESFCPEWAIITTAGGSIVANVNADHRQEANARLISAAPDLLRAAVAALTIVAREQPDGSIMADLLAAIAKADGKEVTSYQPARIPGDAGPCPADMDDSEWLARNNID